MAAVADLLLEWTRTSEKGGGRAKPAKKAAARKPVKAAPKKAARKAKPAAKKKARR